MAQDSLPTPAEQAFITYPTATAPPRELAGQRDVAHQRYRIAGGVLIPAAASAGDRGDTREATTTLPNGNVTVISGGETSLDRIVSGGGALTMPTSRPIAMVCPVCKCTVVTRVHYRSGACTLFAAAGLCCTFPLFFWLPFCCSDLKDVIHVCPNCRSPIGIYHRGCC
ncbi:lipopolysaccharide-induced transcription factor regulating tumor necrosis factor alpha, putative [Perkinsus marinus ATCC 50983]|uniref:Lipopolysaccharide-induced transcription factor regulating tumor necrosis factor alpha, putative n=1 Tax=Perkinsus marinus (strain ATCC 50983 / TXsc) TaxID=423536 RepID=C5L2F6_PERM5|nr:lipopolysaccharide-induced transcription factor regulating tumor necrosis factor alpha, putative [Perkinsus marinus ATCC 50983]EER09050.1 lipopolysaccharide-induced transcription factor regulating tumor necrosis factor alpha, putative [Perkinsus marinus ATCC 50983]|eukprot:XP_002777234.1 lipopolysaccharide-induced transcription factor regulating tumor necrosis factor alpha, putative [Perkinsus marinus ATCC 50983]